MLRNLLYVLIGALIVWGIVAFIQGFFFSLSAKDRELASISLDNMRLDSVLQGNLVNLKPVKTGEFRCDTKGLPDAHSVGRFAYNAMVILMHQDNETVKTGLNFLTIHGFQDGHAIFDVTFNYASQGIFRGHFERNLQGSAIHSDIPPGFGHPDSPRTNASAACCAFFTVRSLQA